MINLIEQIVKSIHPLWLFLGSSPFLLVVMIFSFTIKFYIALNLIIHIQKKRSAHIRRSCFFLILVLISAMMANSAWIVKLIRRLFFPTLNYKLYLLWIRISWSFTAIQYHGLALFIESLVNKNNLFVLRQKILLTITSIIFVSILVLSFFAFNIPYNYGDIEMKIYSGILQYGMFPVLSLSLILTLLKLRSAQLPRLLRMQVLLFIKIMIFPFFILEAAHIYPLSLLRDYVGNAYFFTSVSTLILVYAIFYCTRKIHGLRFLNFKTHVGSSGDFDFIKNFRQVLEQFSTVTNTRELGYITTTFFKQAFNIPSYKTHLYIRKNDTKQEESDQRTPTRHEIIIEKLLPTIEIDQKPLKPIFFTDEVTFNDFYHGDEKLQPILKLLKELKADAFIPIFDKQKIIAYIIIDRYARSIEPGNTNEFYSDLERDYMLVFVDYLGNLIHLLHNKNLDTLVYQEKELKEEVYLKHQEINQYKESLRSFMRTSPDKEIGIIFYKNRHFIFGNKIAHDMITVDLNTHSGHQTTKRLKNITQQVLKYKASQTCLIECDNGQKLVVSGMLNSEHNNVIITVRRPEISDLLRKNIGTLNNPSDRGLLLCLETTATGKLIEDLIPGTGEALLNFKIKLLKATLGKKTVLLDVPDGDVLPMVKLIHHTSLRETLHTITLSSSMQNMKLAINLFGVNPILGIDSKDKPILEKLDNNGTLFIQNVHFLDQETQIHCAEFIRYGSYRPLKSDRKIPSNVRIICSTNQNLQTAVQEGTFSKILFDELSKNVLSMPSLMSLSEKEFDQLSTAFCQRAVKQEAFGNLLELTQNDKKKLRKTHPTSMHELKVKVKNLLIEKSKQHNIDQEKDLFDPAYTLSDPELAKAAQLGKHALRDPKTMMLLWKKFENQNKIALFLGVNRSSVNRRCKEYGLH